MRCPLVKVISGGQTGADHGALAAAKQLGLKTGGWMPRGFLNESGSDPVMASTYGLQEHPSPHFPARTKQNVRDADGTIWVDDGLGTDSRGKRCTLNEVEKRNKPLLVNPTPAVLDNWVRAHNIRILNVAGPRASRDVHAFRRVLDLLFMTFGDCV